MVENYILIINKGVYYIFYFCTSVNIKQGVVLISII